VIRTTNGQLERKTKMKKIVLSALFALGLGMAATTGATAATLGSGLSTAQLNASLVEKAAYACRRVTTCHRGVYGRRVCTVRRVCRHW
jgi:hypothetical protein